LKHITEELIMATKGVPAGYHSITPTLIVRDAAAAIEFYQRAFAAQEIDRMVGPDGSIMHAEIQIGDSRIMLGEENEQWGARSPLSTNGNPGSLHIYVENADASFERALNAGAKVRYPLEDAFWGDRYGKVTDPFGHEWGIATRVKDLSREEMENAGKEWMANAAKTMAAAQS
jgi:PhnB protein